MGRIRPGDQVWVMKNNQPHTFKVYKVCTVEIAGVPNKQVTIEEYIPLWRWI